MRIPFTNLFIEKRSTLKEPSQWMLDYFGKGKSSTGKPVNTETALTHTAVYACVRILSETIASLPLPVYERVERGKKKAKGHYLYEVLHDKANSEMTAFTFKETMMGHLLLRGNAFAELEYDGGGRVRGLWPLNPDKTKVDRLNGELVYVVTLPDGTQKTLHNSRVLHIVGMGFDGLRGYDPIRLMREAVGLGLAAEEYGGRFFGNGAKPGGVLEHPGSLNDESLKNLRNSWEEMHQGLDKQHRIAILEEGLTYKQIGIAPEEAQFLETRKFQVNEIARFFRVPPHMLGDLERATFSNIEHQSIDFVVHSIRPYLVRWEQAINTSLFGKEGQKKYFAEFTVDGLLRGDIKSRYEAYNTGIQAGFLNRNEVREMENRNPVDGLDEYLVPLNMANAEQEEEQPEERKIEKRSIENRQYISYEVRTNIAKSYQRVLRETKARIFKREEADIMRQAKKNLRDVETFSYWLSDFYREHEEYFSKQMLPVLMGLAEGIQSGVANEVNADKGLSTEHQQFVKDYLERMAHRHNGMSIKKLRQRIEKALEEQRDILEDLQDEFDTWQEERVEFESEEETFRFSNAVAKTSYILAGVVVLRWMADSDPCDFCASLDGKTVGVQGSFVKEGEPLEVNGKVLRPSSNIGHGPLHRGCQCSIVAEKE